MPPRHSAVEKGLDWTHDQKRMPQVSRPARCEMDLDLLRQVAMDGFLRLISSRAVLVELGKLLRTVGFLEKNPESIVGTR